MSLIPPFAQNKRGQKRRALILGIDGLSYDLLLSYCRRGWLPNLSAMLQEGACAPMRASLPEVSNVSWTTFSTGMTPGSHGIFGFTDFSSSGDKLIFPNAKSLRSSPFWQRPELRAWRSLVINLPGTWPAMPLSGALVAGFVAPDLPSATWPPSLLPTLHRLGYRLDVDASLGQNGMLEAFLDDCFATLKARHALFAHLFSHENFDILMATITETDRLNHFLWQANDNPVHPFHDRFVSFYQEVDRVVGDLYGRLEKQDVCLLLSDHGFTTARQEISINRFLEEEGFLHYASSDRGLNQLRPDSIAIGLDPARIYLRRSERFANAVGRSQQEWQAIRKSLEEKLAAIRDREGHPIIKQVHRREDLYQGPCADLGPDLVIEPHAGYDFKASFKADSLFQQARFQGMHTADNAVLFVRGAKSLTRAPEMEDVLPTLLACLGIQPTSRLDGRALVPLQA